MSKSPAPVVRSTASASTLNASPSKKLSRARTSWLWLSLASIYGHLFVSAYGENPDSPTARIWADTLGDLTVEQLTRGLEACARSGDDYAPSLPQFHARCLGIPTLAAVLEDLRKNAGKPKGFTRMVWDLVDGYAFTRADQRLAERMLHNAYDLARERVMNGAPIPGDDEVEAIIHDHAAELELYDRQHMQRLRDMGALDDTTTH